MQQKLKHLKLVNICFLNHLLIANNISIYSLEQKEEINEYIKLSVISMIDKFILIKSDLLLNKCLLYNGVPIFKKDSKIESKYKKITIKDGNITINGCNESILCEVYGASKNLRGSKIELWNNDILIHKLYNDISTHFNENMNLFSIECDGILSIYNGQKILIPRESLEFNWRSYGLRKNNKLLSLTYRIKKESTYYIIRKVGKTIKLEKNNF